MKCDMCGKRLEPAVTPIKVDWVYCIDCIEKPECPEERWEEKLFPGLMPRLDGSFYYSFKEKK